MLELARLFRRDDEDDFARGDELLRRELVDGRVRRLVDGRAVLELRDAGRALFRGGVGALGLDTFVFWRVLGARVLLAWPLERGCAVFRGIGCRLVLVLVVPIRRELELVLPLLRGCLELDVPKCLRLRGV